MNPLWSWVLTLMGVTCFFLAGRKVWWTWYLGLATQVVWIAYSLVSQQWGFLAGCALYTAVYANNARKWTVEHQQAKAAAVDQQTAEVFLALDEGEPLTPPEDPVMHGHYRKKPIVVEGRRWDGSYAEAMKLIEWMGGERNAVYQEAVVPSQTSDVTPSTAAPAHLWVFTAEGAMEVSIGDTIIKEPFPIPGREFCPITPQELAEVYDLVEILEGWD